MSRKKNNDTSAAANLREHLDMREWARALESSLSLSLPGVVYRWYKRHRSYKKANCMHARASIWQHRSASRHYPRPQFKLSLASFLVYISPVPSIIPSRCVFNSKRARYIYVRLRGEAWMAPSPSFFHARARGNFFISSKATREASSLATTTPIS